MKCQVLQFFAILCLLVGLTGCDSNRRRAQASAQEFMKAYQEQDVERMRELYPKVDRIEIFYATDSSYLESVDPIEQSDEYRVSFIGLCRVEGDSIETRRVALILRPADESNRAYLIVDSEGVAAWDSYPTYAFALHTGCLAEGAALTDQQALDRLDTAQEMLFDFSTRLYDELEQNIRIMQVHVMGRDAGMVRARAVVSNDSDYTLPDLKYLIVYYDDKDAELASENGWVTQRELGSGESVTFDFLTSYNPAATSCDFKLDFDVDLIMDFVLNDDIYTGNEYAAFIASHNGEGDDATVAV